MLSGLLLALDLRENGSWMVLIQFGEELNLYEIELLAHDYLLPGGCPALVEGRAENGACGCWCLSACGSLRASLVCEDAALPLWRVGQCCLGVSCAARACLVLAVPSCVRA
ncbi:uncharacterized protein DS421_6g187820 [Arachis hypogaea]|nr:uncharacterized protein DS421_6g187820 [Arachis hypogaea]